MASGVLIYFFEGHMRNKLIAAAILFAPSVVFVSLFFCSDPIERGTVEFDPTKIELKDVPAEEMFVFTITARNTDAFRSARIVSLHRAC